MFLSLLYLYLVPTNLPRCHQEYTLIPTNLPRSHQECTLIPTNLPRSHQEYTLIPTNLSRSHQECTLIPTNLPRSHQEYTLIPTNLPRSHQEYTLIPTNLPTSHHECTIQEYITEIITCTCTNDSSAILPAKVWVHRIAPRSSGYIKISAVIPRLCHCLICRKQSQVRLGGVHVFMWRLRCPSLTRVSVACDGHVSLVFAGSEGL